MTLGLGQTGLTDITGSTSDLGAVLATVLCWGGGVLLLQWRGPGQVLVGKSSASKWAHTSAAVGDGHATPLVVDGIAGDVWIAAALDGDRGVTVSAEKMPPLFSFGITFPFWDTLG